MHELVSPDCSARPDEFAPIRFLCLTTILLPPTFVIFCRVNSNSFPPPLHLNARESTRRYIVIVTFLSFSRRSSRRSCKFGEDVNFASASLPTNAQRRYNRRCIVTFIAQSADRDWRFTSRVRPTRLRDSRPCARPRARQCVALYGGGGGFLRGTMQNCISAGKCVFFFFFSFFHARAQTNVQPLSVHSDRSDRPRDARERQKLLRGGDQRQNPINKKGNNTVEHALREFVRRGPVELDFRALPRAGNAVSSTTRRKFPSRHHGGGNNRTFIRHKFQS